MNRQPNFSPSHLNLRLAYWNANGIRNKKLALTDFLHKHNIDAILVNETHLKQQIKFYIPNYRVYRTDRPPPDPPPPNGIVGGGTAILIKSSLSHHYIPSVTQLIETTTVVLNTTSGPIKLIAAYSPPKIAIPRQELTTLFKENTPTLLAGDLNAKHTSWNSRVVTTKGRSLKSISESLNLDVIGPSSPTIYPLDRRKKDDVLDITISKLLPYFIHLTVDSDLGSDHSTVIVTLTIPSTQTLPEKPPPVRVNWKGFRRTLTERTPPQETQAPLTPLEVDAHAVKITELISHSLKINSEPINNRINCPNVPPELAELIVRKRRFRRLWRTTGFRPFKTEYNHLGSKIKSLTRAHYEREWAEKLDSLSARDNSLWDFFKLIRKKKSSFSPPLIDPSTDSLATSNPHKALIFKTLTETIHSPDTSGIPITHFHKITDSVSVYLKQPPPSTEPPFTKSDLIDIITSSNPKKAPGPDQIPTKALQLMPDPTLHYLHTILQSAYRVGHFPTNWRVAHTVMIPKPGKSTRLPTSYRPISLINSLSKIYEKILLKIMKSHITSHNIFIPQQAGFIEHTSTTHQLARLTSFINDGFNTKKFTAAAFLDIERAFDRVWHAGLLSKLIKLDFPKHLILTVNSFLTNRSFNIKILNSFSPPGYIKAGVPQGSVISPTLFNLYINDIPQDPQTQLYLYADDTAIASQSLFPSRAVRAVNRHLETLEAWFRLWNLKANPPKSQAIMFSRNRRSPKHLKFLTLAGSKIPWTKYVKYLGITLDKELRWNRHISQRIQTTQIFRHKLSSLIRFRSQKTLPNALTIFKAVLRPYLSYGFPVWANCSPSNRKALNALQAVTLRMITGAPYFIKTRFIEQDLQIPAISTYLEAQAEKFYSSLPLHPNPIYHPLTPAKYSPKLPGTKKKKKRSRYKQTNKPKKRKKKNTNIYTT